MHGSRRSTRSPSGAPERLRMTHFGEVEPAAAQLEAAAASLRLTAGWAREGDRERSWPGSPS